MNKLIITGIIIFIALTRLIPHPPNFTPLVAIGLFGGAYLKNRWLAFVIPIVSMLAADLLLGFHGTMIWVYGSLILITFAGLLLKNRISLINCTTAIFGSSLIFFLLTNLGVWFSSGFYSKSFDGLLICYTMALPFFVNTLTGSIVYSVVMFGSFELFKRSFLDVVPETIQK